MDRTGRLLVGFLLAITLPGAVLLGIVLGVLLALGYLAFVAVHLAVAFARWGGRFVQRWWLPAPKVAESPPVVLAFPNRR